MPDVTGTLGSRTLYRISETLTARQLSALRRFVARKTVAGDVSLVARGMQKLIESAKRVLN